MSFVEICWKGIYNPRAAFAALRDQTRPTYGLLAVSTRFVLTSLTTIFALRELGVRPFAPPSLTFLNAADYYSAELWFLPVFGLAIWQLMSAIAGSLLALSGQQVSFAKMLNLIGIGMLIPMPAVWAWDWTMIALGSYTVRVMALSHLLFQLWETCLQTVGLRVLFGTKLWVAAAIALLANSAYVLLAMLIVR
jgi:hypothetical protein